MSARPRPVTATFKPPSMDPPVGVRPRAYSLSSGGSTDSLVSVLDHDSAGEYQQDSDDERNQMKIKEPKDEKNKVKRHRPRKPNDMGSKTDLNNKTFTRLGSGHQDETTDSRTENEHNLSCWEVWLLEKAKEERQRLKREARIKRRKEQEANKQIQIEEEKKVKAEGKYKEWLEKVNQQQKRSTKLKENDEKVKKDLEEAKKKDIEKKAKDKFEQWMNKKKEQEKANKMKEAEKKKREEDAKEELKKKSEEAYQRWLENAKNRPRSAHHSFGYTQGKLTGYYDNNAVPVPSYYNPIPWQPVEVPKQKKTRKPRAKSAYRWNPNKYL